jgi:glycosyltransferase involved in cell wall biosynthesis
MRILHILTSRATGAAETYAAGIISGLHEAGLGQNIMAPENADICATLERAGLNPALDILSSGFWRRWKLHRRIARLKPDVIQCWTPKALAILPQTNIPIIGWSGGGDDPQIFAACRFVATPMQDNARRLANNGLASGRVQAIPFFTASSSSPPADRSLLATPREAKVLLSLARLHPDQDLDLLLMALTELPDAFAWLAGEGPGRRALEKRAGFLGLGERVRFLGLRADTGALLRAADVLVVPARREPYGLAILEAWAAGTPVIAAAIGAPAALIEDGKNGLLFPAGDKDALLAALHRFFDDPGLRPRLVAQGYATYARDHAPATVIRRWIDFYRRAAA